MAKIVCFNHSILAMKYIKIETIIFGDQSGLLNENLRRSIIFQKELNCIYLLMAYLTI